jgi:hypothetical protein
MKVRRERCRKWDDEVEDNGRQQEKERKVQKKLEKAENEKRT